MGSATLPGSLLHSPGRHQNRQRRGATADYISQCFLQAADEFCKLEYTEEDLSDLHIKLDRSKILTAGREGMQ